MLEIRNLKDVENRRLRLIPKTGAICDISLSKGAISIDEGNIAICLSPNKSELDSKYALTFKPLTTDKAIKGYYSKGYNPPGPGDNFYHDVPKDTLYDLISFAPSQAEPFTVLPMVKAVRRQTVQKWPSEDGYIGLNMEGLRAWERWEVCLPDEVTEAIRLISATDPTRVVIKRHDNVVGGAYDYPLTAKEYIDLIDNGVYDIIIDQTNQTRVIEYTITLSDDKPLLVYNVNLGVERELAYTSDIVYKDDDIVFRGFFFGITGFAIVDSTRIKDDNNSSYYGHMSNLFNIADLATGTEVEWGSMGFAGRVNSSGDVIIKTSSNYELGDYGYQISILTPTDQDLYYLTEKATGVNCFYNKTSVPEHNFYHHRFYFQVDVVTPPLRSTKVTMENLWDETEWVDPSDKPGKGSARYGLTVVANGYEHYVTTNQASQIFGAVVELLITKLQPLLPESEYDLFGAAMGGGWKSWFVFDPNNGLLMGATASDLNNLGEVTTLLEEVKTVTLRRSEFGKTDTDGLTADYDLYDVIFPTDPYGEVSILTTGVTTFGRMY